MRITAAQKSFIDQLHTATSPVFFTGTLQSKKYYFFGLSIFPLALPDLLPVVLGKLGLGFGAGAGFVVVEFAIVWFGLLVKRVVAMFPDIK